MNKEKEIEVFLMYKNVLVLVDFEYINDNFIQKGIHLAEVNKAKMSFINIDDSDIDYIPYHMDILSPKESDEKYKIMANLVCDPDDIISDEDEIHSENTDRLARANRVINDVIKGEYPIESFFIASGNFVKKINEIITEGNYDLLMIAHHHSGWYHRLFSDHTKDIVNHFDCDILIIQD